MTSAIAEFYKNKNIFLTGGTGFLGIAIIEKLLRCCPEVTLIYSNGTLFLLENEIFNYFVHLMCKI